MVTIFFRATQKGKEKSKKYGLAMRDTNGHSGDSSLVTTVPSGSQITWELEKKSGIRDIVKIWAKGGNPRGKVFKKAPAKHPIGKKFQVDAVETDVEVENEYYITFLADDGTEVTIDPCIRIKPPSDTDDV